MNRFSSCSMWLCQGLGDGVFWSPGQSPVSSVRSPCGEPVPEHWLFSRHSSDSCCVIVVFSKNLRCFPALYVSGFCNHHGLLSEGFPLLLTLFWRENGFPVQNSRHPGLLLSGHRLLDVSHWLSFLMPMSAAVVYSQFIHSWHLPRTISAHLNAVRRHGSIKILSIL